MSFYVLGHTRGLGKYLSEQYSAIGFSRPEYILDKDINTVVNKITDDSIVVLNAYANGSQIEYLNLLSNRTRVIVCGSIASTYHDPSLPLYSQHKEKLEKRFIELSISNRLPMLYLKLTSSSYKDFELIKRTIDFWIENPDFTFAGFNIKKK